MYKLRIFFGVMTIWCDEDKKKTDLCLDRLYWFHFNLKKNMKTHYKCRQKMSINMHSSSCQKLDEPSWPEPSTTSN